MTSFKLHPITSNKSQQHTTWCANARNMLGPTMLRLVGQQCCERLQGPLASMCSSSRPKMQGMFLLFDESLHVFNVHFLIVPDTKKFRFNLRGLETNIIDWKTIEKHIHCGLQIRQRLSFMNRKKKEPLHKGKCFSVHVVTSALLCCFHRFCFGQCKFKLWCIYKLNFVSMLAH